MFRQAIDDEIAIGILLPEASQQLFNIVEANREHLRQWLPWLDQNKSERDTLAFITQALEGFSRGHMMVLGIYFQQNIVGILSFNHIDRLNHNASVGYWLSDQHQGRGIMSRCVARLCHYGFNELKLQRIEIRCATDNYKSRAIPERLGFVHEGICRSGEYLYGIYLDLEIYGMLRQEWSALQNSELNTL